MIYLNEPSEQVALFENLLEHTRTSVLEQLKTKLHPSTLSGVEFELIVFENAVLNAQGTIFEGKLTHTPDRAFPDIVAAGLFGIEVKATKKDDWVSIGNSVLESSRITTVEKIYMFFGKLGGIPDIKIRNYEDCLRGIAVTHYPRYQIDMLMDKENSIFRKMGVEYETIRTSSNPVSSIRKYYKSQLKEGDALWWIGDDVEDMPSLSPIIKNFSSLDKDTQDTLRAEMFVYFPEIFSRNKQKYDQIPAYLASRYGVVSHNVRDIFTAGGQVEITYNGARFLVSQIVGNFLHVAPRIRYYLSDKNQEQLFHYWQKDSEDYSTTEEVWLKEIDLHTLHMGLPVKISTLYLNEVKTGK